MTDIAKIVSSLAEELPNMSPQEQRKALVTIRRLKNTQSTTGKTKKIPTTDDELWDWIKCAKPGSLVRIQTGKRGSSLADIPIEELVDGDGVLSYSNQYITPNRKIKILETFYNGDMYKVTSAGFSTEVTPNHKWPVRFNCTDNFPIVYLMKKGNLFRIGKTRFFVNGSNKDYNFGLGQRMAAEKADCAWILKLCSLDHEALLYEKYLSSMYGIPEVAFQSAHGGWSQNNIDKLFSMFDSSVQRINAERCLKDCGKDILFPMFVRNIGRTHKNYRLEVAAINLIPGMMEFPLAGEIPENTNRINNEPFWNRLEDISIKKYNGKVYSIDVEQHHKYIQDGLITCNSELGYEIPRVAVCEDHTAPFDYVTDFIFERYKSLLVLGGRESAKTLNTAIANFVNSEIKPGCESCTFANIEQQSNKSYSYIKSFLYTIDSNGKKVLKSSIEGDPLRKETKWKTGSKIEVIIGTVSGVNSPHPQKVHADEVDLLDDDIWEESRNMASSKKFPDGSMIKAQNIATSTLKSTKGIMQRLMDESEKAEKDGLKPTWKVYKSCVYEVAEEVPNCRTAPKNKREDRLKELGKDPCELCECNKIVKGQWAENVPRTLDSVCKGKFFRSRGWMSYDDITEKFVQNIPSKWASQLECRRPMADGLYLPTWDRDRHTIKGYEPRPEYGLLWQSVDWGGTEASAVLWMQGPLHQAVEVRNNIGTTTIIPQGAYVCFKELYEAAMGATRLAAKVIRQEIQYKNQFPGWRVKARFADMAGKQQRLDWREHNPPLRTVWYISREVDPQIECLQALVSDNLHYVDSTGAPNLCDDYESWRQKDGKEIHDQSSHGPASSRYLLKNVTTIIHRYSKVNSISPEPVVAARESPGNFLGAQAQEGVGSTGEFESGHWLNSFGPPERGDPWRP